MSVGPALMYGGPKDSAVYPPVRDATVMPAFISHPSCAGRYVRMDDKPEWMTFLPQRSMDTTIYLWEQFPAGEAAA